MSNDYPSNYYALSAHSYATAARAYLRSGNHHEELSETIDKIANECLAKTSARHFSLHSPSAVDEITTLIEELKKHNVKVKGCNYHKATSRLIAALKDMQERTTEKSPSHAT